MALTSAEADAVLSASTENDRHVVVYQNRRWDPDFLALRRAVDQGRLGEIFHLEAFVGGYGHPCNYWHSDAAVSGGAIFDWGSHYLDQVLLLVEDEVSGVSAANHKRRWHDVTNADHSRMSLAFAGGAEATFIHSDLAAALKPKWYVLGTEGALVGHWRQETVVSRTDIGTLDEDPLAPADSPALLDLHHPDGSVTRLSTPSPPAYAFHRELADQLVAGLPMSVTAEQSRRVVAVMEAAEMSAASGGSAVVPS
jgi:predicted dehydrogenase